MENNADGMDVSTENILNPDPTLKRNLFGILMRPFRILFPSPTFMKFFIASIIPAISKQVIPLFYTGQIPDSSSLALAGQFTFISVVLEVIEEGIINSLFHFVGKNYKGNREAALGGLKLCFLFLLGFGVILAGVVLIFTRQFVSMIDTPPEIVEKTKNFLWMSSFSFPLILFNSAITKYLFITTSRLIILAQVIQVIETFFLNYFLFGQHDMSLRWGLDELGTYKVIQNGVNLFVNLILLHWVEKMTLKQLWWNVPLKNNLGSNISALFSVSWPNFGDSAIRNFFYFVVTLKFVNSLGATEAGAWNLLTTIMFGVVLLPMNSVATLVGVSIGHGAKSASLKYVIRDTSKQALSCLTAWTVLLSLVCSIFWTNIAAYFSPSNPDVQELSISMFKHTGWTYIIFSYNTVLDNIFYGTGDTVYVFYQSLITNLVVYATPWILFEMSVVVPSYWWVLGLWAGGMCIDFVLTILFSFYLWNNLN